MSSFFNKIKTIFVPNSGNIKSSFTNENLLNELKLCFEQNLKEESVGSRMLYPTKFSVLLNSEDFSSREKGLPFVVQETVNAFYLIIEKYKIKYQEFSPPSLTWRFQFSEKNEFQVSEAEIEIIEPGKPFILAEIYSNNISSNNKTASSTRVSFKPKNSDGYSHFDINYETLRALDILGKNLFEIKFDKSLSRITSTPKNKKDKALANITFSLDSLNNIIKTMVEDDLFISGSQDRRKDDDSVLIIPNDLVSINHIQIKHNQADDSFLIAAFSKVKLNERTLAVSMDNNNIIWHPLAKKSTFLLADSVVVEFKSLI